MSTSHTTPTSTPTPKGRRASIAMPSTDALKQELSRSRRNSGRRRILRNTLYALITVAAAAVLVATLWMPVLQIYGTSMTPALTEGDIVVSLKGSDYNQGDIVGFYYGNKLLVKRCIAGPGDWVDINEDGTVYVNGAMLDEPYLMEKALGDCDLKFPYQVPDGKWFLMGDHRSTSVDSRNSSVGCVSDEQIVGRIAFRIWPLSGFGSVS